MRGTVKFFNATKAYGFITPVSGGADVFVHITATLKAGLPPLVAGQTIHFDIANDRRRGTHATNLRYQENADEPDAILKLPLAGDWHKPGIARVRGAPADSDAQWREATRATIEVVVRKLLGLGWTRGHTSARRVDGRGAPPDGEAHWRGAPRATIEVVVRKLRGLVWTRRHTSARRVDGRAESRY